ncbi:MAG: Zn-ribbon domain-containing OB-fold protein [Candidatus Bathyarchaeota archaeon]
MYSVPMHWRRLRERYNLLGTRCEICGKTYFPLRKICPQCRRDGKPVTVKFSGKGTVFTYTVIRVPSDDFESYAPYAVGIIQLDEGPKVTSQIVDCRPEDVHIGMSVEVCFRKLTSQGKEGIICYGFKFRPIINVTKS